MYVLVAVSYFDLVTLYMYSPRYIYMGEFVLFWVNCVRESSR